MARLRDNYDAYATSDFSTWAYSDGLTPIEQALVEHFLRPEADTVEAGTAGGRIVRGMRALGFRSLTGFDYVPELVEQARRNDIDGTIRFDVQDATSLSYRDASFDQAVYLQQLLSLLDTAVGRVAGAEEAYRVLRPGGTAVFSVCRFEGRTSWSAVGVIYKVYLAYLRVFRLLMRSPRSVQEQPWLKIAGRFKPDCLLDRPPYAYWYRQDELLRFLRSVGFAVVWQGAGLDVQRELGAEGRPERTFYYVVARKPGPDDT